MHCLPLLIIFINLILPILVPDYCHADPLSLVRLYLLYLFVVNVINGVNLLLV
jgi:hypothetical protein